MVFAYLVEISFFILLVQGSFAPAGATFFPCAGKEGKAALKGEGG